MKFHKYHALGNDYVVLHPAEIGELPSGEAICRICHRNFGVGSDGILYGPSETGEADFGLRIFNPDGSEAEKSGNGLRIFARYLWDCGKVGSEAFTISTPGGVVEAKVGEDGSSVTIEMGRVSFNSSAIPVAGRAREVINEVIEVEGKEITFCAATIGNPHCVIVCDEVSEVQARRLGPAIENDERFANRTNVQFMKILDRSNIRIEIWERGAGYTLASGSSSCVAVAVARKLDLCDGEITAHTPGGELDIRVADDFSVTMTGSVTKVADGIICDEMFEK
ncbi:MAG: diaminopimelate epimerase [Sedimentisphaerales bacterium]|nr:diaminopimelate epimerase [Sedimentisphaerales bacterium]